MSAPVLYYVVANPDETMPCAPTLNAWAEWLSKPDESWPHPVAVVGETFAISTLILLGAVRVDRVDGKWEALSPITEGTEEFFLFHDADEPGWDAEFSGSTIEDALDCWDEDGPVWLACVKSGDDFIGRLATNDTGPTLILEPVQ